MSIILLRNVNPSFGMCNGTRFVITKLRTDIIQAKAITRSKFGD